MREFGCDGDLTTYASGISEVDRTMCCAFCGQRLNSVVLADSGRTEIRCGSCDARTQTPVFRTATPISRDQADHKLATPEATGHSTNNPTRLTR